MVLTIKSIRATRSDKQLFDKLTAELTRRLPVELHDDLDRFVEEIECLPPGLRAMAATFKLDVSMALDDLGWHFANFHHREYCNETSRAFWELEAQEVAQIFDQAYQLVLPYWDQISDMLAVEFKVFSEWYYQSDLDKALSPLNCRLWDICEKSPEFRLMQFWMLHARKHPERYVES
jgi:hypothetical protein